MLRRYVHGTGVDDPQVWYEGAGVANPRYLYADHQGSIVAVGDGAGATLGINAYDEYGIPNADSDALTGTGNIGRFQYTGQAWIPELGMYHYKARIYSPTLGRFLQTDPIGYDDQINLYAYVKNDPMNNVDPSGDECETPTGSRICQSTTPAPDTSDHTYRNTLAAGGAAAGAFLGGIAGGAAGGTGGAAAGVACGPGAVACSPAGALAGGTAGAAEGAVLGGAAGGVVGGFIGDLIDKGIAMMSSGGDGGSGSGGNSGRGAETGQGSGGTPRNLGNLSGRAGEQAADVARSRGASGSNVNQMGHWADKPLGEVARAAASGDRSAATALKIIKQANRLGQKF